MKTRSFFIIAFVFLLQFFSSCYYYSCPTSEVYHYFFKNITLSAWNTGGLSEGTPVVDSVYRENLAFKFKVRVTDREEERGKTPILAMGFNTVAAMEYNCDIDVDQHVFQDTIKTLQLIAIPNDSTEAIDVSARFQVMDIYRHSAQPISEYVEIERGYGNIYKSFYYQYDDENVTEVLLVPQQNIDLRGKYSFKVLMSFTSRDKLEYLTDEIVIF